MFTGPNVTVMRGNIEINICYIDERKCANVLKKLRLFLKITQTIFLIYTHVLVHDVRRTCGLKIGFNNEVEIVYLCHILSKPI